MFKHHSEVDARELVPGVSMKALTWGDSMMLTRFEIKKGGDVPAHEHPHEQIGYLVSGSITLTVGGEAIEVKPGGSWCIAPNVSHRAFAHEDSVAVEVFSPMREDYLP